MTPQIQIWAMVALLNKTFVLKKLGTEGYGVTL